jgi:hypothetical protein
VLGYPVCLPVLCLGQVWGADYKKPMRLDISTVVLNDVQAEFGTAQVQKRARGKMQHSCFSKVVYVQRSRFREQVSLVTMSRPPPRELLFHLLVYHWI